MLQNVDSERTERLWAELKAIALWDESYWRRSNHEWWETIALETRRKRRCEILRELEMPDRRS